MAYFVTDDSLSLRSLSIAETEYVRDYICKRRDVLVNITNLLCSDTISSQNIFLVVVLLHNLCVPRRHPYFTLSAGPSRRSILLEYRLEQPLLVGSDLPLHPAPCFFFLLYINVLSSKDRENSLPICIV